MSTPSKFCVHCGAALSSGARFCEQCGQPAAPAQASAVPDQPAPIPPAQAYPIPQAAMPPQPPMQLPPRKSRAGCVIAVLLALMVLCCGVRVAGAFMFCVFGDIG
ncbi:MAG: zinc-ribbon domain-containing protein, partial [Candidatus Roseilinea sp.]|uniref:zinc-ribbon domain-containing protein n=1 Tax=Candidatus Roseilinea sp. TaxID=2838777 RepID=UPI00404A9E33